MQRSLTDLEKSAHEFLHYRDTTASGEKVRDRAKAVLKAWLTLKSAAGKMVNGDVDENGNRTLYFDEPLTIGETTYTGVQAQKKEATPAIDIDAAKELLLAKGANASGEGRDDVYYDKVFKRRVIREFDEDALLVLNQKGVVSDDELDALLVSGEPTYALVVVKG